MQTIDPTDHNVCCPQKRTRMSDTNDDHFRIGDFYLFPDSDDRDDYRAGSSSLFSDPGDASATEMHPYDDTHPPPFRLEGPRMCRKIRSRIPQHGLSDTKPTPDKVTASKR